MHDDYIFFSGLVTLPRLMEFVYSIANTVDRLRSRPADESTRILVDSNPLTANTRGATPRKNKGKAKVVDKGKAKVVEKGRARSLSPKNLNSSPCRHVGSSRLELNRWDLYLKHHQSPSR